MKRYAIIDRYAVDLLQVASLAHNCRPELCRNSLCCCACYDVYVERHELSTIIGLFSVAGEFCPRLKSGNELVNIFEDVGQASYIIDTDDRDNCFFLYHDQQGLPLCSLHSAALKIGRHPYHTKPYSCSLWPLAIEDSELPILTVQDDALSFPCNSKRDPELMSGLDEGVAEIIQTLWGQEFLDKVCRAVEKLLHPSQVQ